MTDLSIKARRMPVDMVTSKAPGDLGRCDMLQVECGLSPGDSLSVGRYPDGDYVLGIVNHQHNGPKTTTVVLSPETMKDLAQAIFQMVQS